MAFADLENIPAIVLVANREGEIVFANIAVEKILGFTKEEVLGNGWWNLTHKVGDKDDRKHVIAGMADGSVTIDTRNLFENPIQTHSGEIVWTQWTNQRTADGYLIGIAQDITSKKELELELKKSHRENELLLKELHHRVKNNLQLVSSYLNIQFSSFESEDITEAVVRTKQRIHAMAILHNSQYNTVNSESVNFNAYFTEVARAVAHEYDPHSKTACEFKFDGAIKNSDQAMHVGLLLTELISNSFKHAFNPDTEASIEINLSTHNTDAHHLIYHDSAKSIRHEEKESNGIGLEIISALIDQLDGERIIDSENEFHYSILF